MANVYATLWGLMTFSGFVTTLLTPQAEKYAAVYREAITQASLNLARRWVEVVRWVPGLVLIVVVGLSILSPLILRSGGDRATGWDLFLLAIAVAAQAGFTVTIRALVHVLPLTVSLIAPMSVEERPDAPSPSTRKTTGVRFENRTRQALELHWIDFRGSLVSYGTIDPLSGDNVQITYVGHRFVLTDPDGREIVMFEALDVPGLAVIDDPVRQTTSVPRQTDPV